MGFRETVRAQAAMVRREWACDVCEHHWRTVEPSSSEVAPECPSCAEVAPRQVFRPIAIRGNASRALDLAQSVIENDYGLTDARDHLQAGETAAMAPPPIQTAEADAITREIINMGGTPDMAPHFQAQVKNFFGAGSATAPAGPPNPFGVPTNIEQARQMAAPAAAASTGMGADPIGLLHEAGKKGLDPVARGNLKVHSK